MGPIFCPETSVTTILRCVTSQKSANLLFLPPPLLLLQTHVHGSMVKGILLLSESVYRCLEYSLEEWPISRSLPTKDNTNTEKNAYVRPRPTWVRDYDYSTQATANGARLILCDWLLQSVSYALPYLCFNIHTYYMFVFLPLQPIVVVFSTGR
jgi:hypothetical protein